MIVLEGPDGAGKTNLAIRLSVDLNLPIEPKWVRADMTTAFDLKTRVERDLNTWPRAALYDRYPLISELIYGPISRRRLRPGFDDRVWLSRMLTKFYAKMPTIIYCMPSFYNVYLNVKKTETDNEVVQDTIEQIYLAYQVQIARDADAFLWDYTQPDADQFYRQLLSTLRRREHIASVGSGCD